MVDYFDANAVGSVGGDNVAPSAIGTSVTAATNGGDAGMEDEIMVSRSRMPVYFRPFECTNGVQ